MRARDAKKLRNEDEVTIKKTGEIARILKDPLEVKVAERATPIVIVTVASSSDGYCELIHDEIS